MVSSQNLRNTLIAGAIAAVAALIGGSCMGWMSPSEAKLSEENGTVLLLTKAQLSWVGSLLALGSAVGPLAAGKVADRIGRKWSLIWLTVPFLLGWLLKGLAEPCDSVEMLYAARFIHGVANGVVFTALPMYSGEIAADSVRGALGSFLQLLITIGYIYEYAIGPYVPFWVLPVVSAVIPAVWAVAMFFMPDSPYYLISKGRDEEARSALKWLRGTNDVDDEMNEMKEEVKESQLTETSLRDLITNKGNRKALIISMGLVAGQQLSGINAILFYSTTIFEKTHSSLSADVATIIIGVVMFLASCITPLVVDRLGRRPLFFISAIGMTLGQAVLGAYFYMSDEDESSVEDIGILPIISLIFYIIVYCPGFGALPWAVMGELFPSNVKANASSVTASFCWILAFFITKFFSDLADAIGMSYTFWMFGIFCIIAGLFVFFLLPETKGKSLLEIQEMLNK
ncbi:facilitated trehalose transporter Tret1 [Anabrus simplex]|uniref:facilitated trehalose transporter Tret1 n=1 Tax=Anabrus simplex TaxID=316456 RepID=UPI0035A3BA45